MLGLWATSPRWLGTLAQAQQPADAAPGAQAPADAPPPEAAVPEAAPPEAAPPADAPAAAPARAGQVAPAPARSTVWWFIRTSGAIGLVLLILSIYFVATVTRLFLEMRQQVATPPELVADLMELLQRREFKEIYATVKEDKSFFSRLLSAGIAELPNGLAEARDSMERVGEAVTVEMEKKISMLAVLGTLGPMIGLLGTLKGMIASFSVIATSDVQLKASEVAEGISEALLLTFEGVALSVPAIYFYAVFRNRVSTISVSTLLQADEYLRHFAHAARAKSPPAGATPAAAVPVAPRPAKP
ncbi:MAG: MotA/TolQ/ExbB proton channel family protein [Pirellulales bacterium]